MLRKRWRAEVREEHLIVLRNGVRVHLRNSTTQAERGH